MRMDNKDFVDYPRELVYQTFRDKVYELADYLPNVDKIEVVQREWMNEDHLRILAHWHTSAPVPPVVKKFINPKVFSYKDYANWYNSEFKVDWRIETFWLSNLYTCSGTTYYIEVSPGRTLVHLVGDLTVNIDAIPQIPRFLRKSIGPQAEKFVIGIISPNLSKAAQAVQKYLDSIKAK